ncbi:hypothetical protein A2397_03835 [Candidatus Amesbacteria bacterium RIFOXYB1_FULL_44_23]|uniref:Uncharacterized protein n=1 Tax=Candidatus Amesbacteria bacterium RIFOXYB1_FULL_44_23 TaxID=1797263 RepID=A0A1F4ZXG5_9BACT|nr:MAG: hypothetical protein A2397_03835 [Candidatus Amesbacteria bacterium RIFOXYB1_FULL_44_23]
MKLLAQAIGITTGDTRYATIESLQPQMFVSTLINMLLGLAGVASFVFLLWGGVQWIMAGGDKDALDKSRKKLVGALIGLSLVFSSYAILYIIRVLFNINVIGWTLDQIQ